MMKTMALAAVVGLGVTYAQERRTMRADIPFAFAVGGTQLPAGEYTVSQNPANGYLAIASLNTGARAAVFTVKAGKPGDGLSKLVFHEYAGKYFLAQVATPMLDFAHQLPKSSAEREMAKGTALELASVRITVQ
jgi:hypothetical protein